MSTAESMASVRDTVASVTQRILRVDDRNIRVAKAEARSDGVRGSVLHWHEADGRAVLSPANINGRVAASLRAVRRARGLSQHDLAQLAGVTASAISQAERAERGLSLGTLAQLSRALGMTIDDLLHGDGPDAYRIGRRPDDPHHSEDGITALLGDANADLSVDLVRLPRGESARPAEPREGTGIVAVATGLVQVACRRSDAHGPPGRGAGRGRRSRGRVARHRPVRGHALLDRARATSRSARSIKQRSRHRAHSPATLRRDNSNAAGDASPAVWW